MTGSLGLKKSLLLLFYMIVLSLFNLARREHRASLGGGEEVPRYVTQPVGFLAVQGE